jgi:hypothetical protein
LSGIKINPYFTSSIVCWGEYKLKFFNVKTLKCSASIKLTEVISEVEFIRKLTSPNSYLYSLGSFRKYTVACTLMVNFTEFVNLKINIGDQLNSIL